MKLFCFLFLGTAALGCVVEEAADDDDGRSSNASGGGATTGSATGGSGAGTGPGGATGAGGDPMPGACGPGKDGPASGASGELTPGGLDYNVRTPEGYDPTVMHPLLVVYSPAGVTNPGLTEQFTGLTTPARARGWLVAYANHVSPADTADISDAALVIDGVAARWCVDPSRVYLTGHSDGGSIATLVAINDLGNPKAAAIAPSAAGAKGSFLAQVACPPTQIGVMVLHSINDGLFPPPDFGEGHANWWASCNGCSLETAPLPDGCAGYQGCAVATEYCEGTGVHGQWPPKNEQMLDFLAGFVRPQ